MTTTQEAGAKRASRSEIEVAADTVAALIQAGIVRVAHITAAADAVGLMPGEIQAALERRRQYGHIPPRRVPTGETPPPAEEPGRPPSTPERRTPVTRARSTSSHPNAGRTPWNKKPEGETRKCIKCEQEKPIGEFLQRTDSNSRRTECNDCRVGYQRNRYLSVETSKRLGVILQFLVEHGDPVAGTTCPRCERTIEVGDVVETGDIPHIHHLYCPTEET